MEAAKSSVSRMIDLLGKENGLSPEDAYILCGVCGDLRISELVDMLPKKVVSLYLPKVLFTTMH